jgi:hypothetical protein
MSYCPGLCIHTADPLPPAHPRGPAAPRSAAPAGGAQKHAVAAPLTAAAAGPLHQAWGQAAACSQH